MNLTMRALLLHISTNRNYFLAVAMTNNMVGSASLKEKEMVASLFCKLANLMRTKSTCIGSDTKVRQQRVFWTCGSQLEVVFMLF